MSVIFQEQIGAVSQVVGPGIDINSTYVARVTVHDSETTATDTITTSETITIGTVSYPMDVRAQGKGIAFGKVAETDNLFDVKWNTKFRGNVTAEGYLYGTAKIVSHSGTGEEGNIGTGWYKAASQTMSGWSNFNAIYLINANYQPGWYGIFEIQMRSNNTSIQCWTLRWLNRNGFDEGHIKVVISGMTWTLYIYNPTARYGRTTLSEVYRANINGDGGTTPITYYDLTTKESSTPEATKTSVDDKSYITASLSNRPIIHSDGNWNNINIPLDVCSCKLGDGLELVSGAIQVKRKMKILVSAMVTHVEAPVAAGEWDIDIFADTGGALARAHGNTMERFRSSCNTS